MDNKLYLDPAEDLPYFEYEDIEEAIKWSQTSSIPIIYSMSEDDLDKTWRAFNEYPANARSASDNKCLELFGFTNEELYNRLKSFYAEERDSCGQTIPDHYKYLGPTELLINYNEQNIDVPTIDLAKQFYSMVHVKRENYDDAIIRGMIDRVCNKYIASHQNLRYDPIPCEDLPFFTPEELIDIGVSQSTPDNTFYDCEPIEPEVITDSLSEDVQSWFSNYANACNGYGQYNPKNWVDTVRRLQYKMKLDEKKDKYKQALLDLGWPPEAEFSPENRVKATKRCKAKLAERNGSSQFVDLRGLEDIEDSSNTLIEGAVKAPNYRKEGVLRPVFIVLEEGKSLMSATIKKVTNSPYSHAAISFDPKMEEFYSFGIENSVNGIRGGFIKERIKDKDPDRRMGVFAIFLKEEDWLKLKSIVQDFIDNAKKTSYSYLGLLTNLFKIPMEMDKTLICSQFVDKILKLIDVDLSHTKSGFVAPSDYERYARENKKIYILFDDIVAKFNQTKIARLVQRMAKKAEPIKEDVFNFIELKDYSLNGTLEGKIYNSMLDAMMYVEAYLLEAKEPPIKFDKDGNLILSNIKKNPYAAEYNQAHILLKEYYKSGNTEGIKHELYRLWALNIELESKIHSPKFEKMTNEELNNSTEMQVRARVLNDFKFYLDKVLEQEPRYKFTEEFAKSEYYNRAVKIDRNTIKWTSKILKELISPL